MWCDSAMVQIIKIEPDTAVLASTNIEQNADQDDVHLQ